MELQNYPLRNVSVTTRSTSNTSNTEMALSYQIIYAKMLIYHQLLNGVLLRKCYQKCNYIFVNYVSGKFYISKSLNYPNLLSKKSDLINTYCHQSNYYKKVLKRIDTVREEIQWIDILFLILVVLCLICQYVAIHATTY